MNGQLDPGGRVVLLVFQITGFPWRFHQSRITNHQSLLSSEQLDWLNPATYRGSGLRSPENENRID